MFSFKKILKKEKNKENDYCLIKKCKKFQI